MTSTEPALAAVCVGLPRTQGEDAAADPFDRTWTSGIFKAPVAGAVRLTAMGLAGDGQADLKDHGGRDKALCAYPARHYPHWRGVFGVRDLAHGAFGENLTIAGLTEDGVCIGDVWAVDGGVLIEVSQPRQPCWKLARKWRIRTLVDDVLRHGGTGWYFRVLRDGSIAAGMPLELRQRPHPAWTIAAANAVMHRREGDTGALAAVPALSESWKRTLSGRLSAHS